MLKFQQKEKNMENFLNILKNCPLFEHIDDESLIRMLKCLGARCETYEKKSTVLQEGITVKHLGIVLSGSVQIIQIDYYGNRSIISTVTEGQLFAEAFACADVTSLPVSIVANERSNIMLIDCDHILHTCKNGCGFHQQMIYNLMKDMAQKTIDFHKRIEVTSKRTTREKLLTYLSIVSKEKGSSRFDIPFDRQELADYLEVDRSGLSAEISKLRNEGVLKSNKSHFVLL